MSVAWAVDPRTMHPLLLLAGKSALVHIWDVEACKMAGVLRGHGGVRFITVLFVVTDDQH
jgi:hypothetical protein